MSMDNFALVHTNQGRWKEAVELDIQVVEMRRKVFGAEHPDTLTSMGNLALVYTNQEQWKAAEELGVQVVEVTQRVLRAEHG